MSEYSAFKHRMMGLVRFDPTEPARKATDHLLVSPGVTWSFLVPSDDGDVVINTGMPSEGPHHRARYEQLLGRKLDVRKIVITQHHPDHMGGWQAFNDPGCEIIAHANYPTLWHERRELGEFFRPRERRVLPTMTNAAAHKDWHKAAEEIPSLTTFTEHLDFIVGGRRFELHWAPSGEAIDGIIVWLPEERSVLVGNLMGALPGSLPHFYTVRGDRQRSLTRFLVDVNHLIGLKPKLLALGHGDPIIGDGPVSDYLTKLRDAVQYIRDETIKGMSAGKDLHTLMREIKLPKNLEHLPGRGRLGWYVRAMWEEITGWFRQESTTELYDVPQKEVWGDLVELAGKDKLIARAGEHLAAGRHLHALHLTDIVLKGEPDNRPAREIEIAALTQLMEAGKGELLDEQGWLETSLNVAREAIGETS